MLKFLNILNITLFLSIKNYQMAYCFPFEWKKSSQLNPYFKIPEEKKKKKKIPENLFLTLQNHYG